MQAEFARQGLTHIATILKRGAEWPPQALEAAIAELANEPDEAMKAAVRRATLELSPGYLPPMRKVLDIVIDEASKIRLRQGMRVEAEHAQQKRKEQAEASALSMNPQSRYQEFCQKAIHAMFTTRTPEDKLEVFRVMEQHFPGVGWAHEGARLQRFYEEEA